MTIFMASLLLLSVSAVLVALCSQNFELYVRFYILLQGVYNICQPCVHCHTHTHTHTHTYICNFLPRNQTNITYIYSFTLLSVVQRINLYVVTAPFSAILSIFFLLFLFCCQQEQQHLGCEYLTLNS
jgi:hypothetical protein